MTTLTPLAVIYDDQGIIRHASQAFYESFSASPGARLGALLPGLPLFQSAEATTHELEAWVCGERRWLSITLSRLSPDPEGGQPAPLWSLSAQDITGRARSDEERRREATQLHQAQKLEAIGLLAGGVAHDFNNLLTVIGMHAEIIEARPGADASLLRSARAILQAQERAAELSRRLLAFGRKQMIKTEVVDLDRVIHGVLPMLRRLIDADIEFTQRLEADLWPVRADVGQLEQVLMNLVINARDAMPDGGKLAIESSNRRYEADELLTRPEILPGDYVFISVSDTGHGIPKALQERIFEPFFTTKGVGRGTGLGLSTVHGIIRQLGGHIWLYSEPDVGTTFRVGLPRLVGAEVLEDETQVMHAPPRGDEVLMVVEDDDEVRDAVCTILVAAGYTLYEARDGREALDKLPSLSPPPALILSDLIMPRMKGQQLAVHVRATQPEIRFLFMSGYSEDVVRERMGIADVALVRKPPSVRELRLAIRKALDE